MKEVIKKNLRLFGKTVGINKSVVIFGTKRKKLQMNIRDKDVNQIKQIFSKVTEEISDKDVEEFARVVRYEDDTNRPMKISILCSNSVEEMVRNAKKLGKAEGYIEVRIKRYLSLDGRELLKKQRRLRGEITIEQQKNKGIFYKEISL